MLLNTKAGQLALLAIETPQAQQPPGMEKINTILGWGMWAFTIACLGGFMLAGAKMLKDHRNGMGASEGALSHVAWVAAGCLVGAAAGPLVTALIG